MLTSGCIFVSAFSRGAWWSRSLYYWNYTFCLAQAYSNILNPKFINSTSISNPVPVRRKLHNDSEGSWLLINKRSYSHGIGRWNTRNKLNGIKPNPNKDPYWGVTQGFRHVPSEEKWKKKSGMHPHGWTAVKLMTVLKVEQPLFLLI